MPIEDAIMENIYGSQFECACGRTHRIEPREVLYCADAERRLPTLLAQYTGGRRVAVLMDARTRQAAGLAVVEALAEHGWQVNELLVADPADGRSPVCDEPTFVDLRERLGAPDILVPVGSGVINDVAKWLAADAELPFVCFATAASMNGYASANVAPTIQGVKTLRRARPPRAVVSSAAVLAAAPYELTAAGLGDVLAKSASSSDWLMNHLLFGDYYCERAVGLIAEVEPRYLEHPERVRACDEATLAALFEALLLTGVAMTMAETSAPASGAEHLLSHSLDMMSTIDGAPHDLHGRQVGVGTILAAALTERVLALESPEFIEPTAGIDEAFWGPLAGALAEQYAQKVARLRQARAMLSQGQAWDELRRRLEPLFRRPATIQACLREAGAGSPTSAATASERSRRSRTRTKSARASPCSIWPVSSACSPPPPAPSSNNGGNGRPHYIDWSGFRRGACPRGLQRPGRPGRSSPASRKRIANARNSAGANRHCVLPIAEMNRLINLDERECYRYRR
ncbi:iron-containing alcohol dehydrogenase [Candidatus Sumerlaeota bacterium]